MLYDNVLSFAEAFHSLNQNNNGMAIAISDDNKVLFNYHYDNIVAPYDDFLFSWTSCVYIIIFTINLTKSNNFTARSGKKK